MEDSLAANRESMDSGMEGERQLQPHRSAAHCQQKQRWGVCGLLKLCDKVALPLQILTSHSDRRLCFLNAYEGPQNQNFKYIYNLLNTLRDPRTMRVVPSPIPYSISHSLLLS
ncbi:hypothetical protein SAY87_006364 [Trapa incisa]|uniref:Uncharacterized protein n=1 Tax=Trapa incisa TaxID=236973 RepID=A0AAN7JZN8_9MYRT|nr:hypothetical protein SAY87_006364 [Trapa incisa]